MTRKEEIEKQAFAVYPIIMETLIPLSADHEEVKQDCNQFLRKAYIDGIEWSDKTMIDKVCEWLVDNIYGYVEESQKYSDGYSIDLSSLVSDFRKAMEE